MEYNRNFESTWYDNKAPQYERFAKEISEILRKILERKKIPYHSIVYRLKEKKSFLNKCQKEKYVNPTEEIMDLAGIRIIAFTNQEIEQICEIVKKEFEIDNENSGNKAETLNDDQVGYLSVHYIIQLNRKRLNLAEYEDYKELKGEIQIRTLLQHAWAEIEHDRNYKFSGVLPKNIKRRFYLIAGVLEMMDREFELLSKDIDYYSKEAREKVTHGNFNMEIDSTSLEQYLMEIFGENISKTQTGIAINSTIIKELERFGFKTIHDIDQAMTDEIIELIKLRNRTYIGILRDLMIFTDVDKYFKKAYQDGWQGTTYAQVKFWETHGVTHIRKYLQKAGISIKSE